VNERAAEKTRDRQIEIYDAAVELFRQRGYFGTSMRELAARVGTQMSTLYHHYSHKQDLLMAIMERTMHDLTGDVTTAVGGRTDDCERLAAAVHAHVTFHASRASEAFVTDAELRALEPENYERIVRLRDAHQSIFERLVDDGVASGTFKVADPKLTTYAVMTMCTAVGVWYRPGGRLSQDEIAQRYSEIALSMVGC
jgi:TetR/AcrR family transcriptional regulator, cholesterol catabolism regulator